MTQSVVSVDPRAKDISVDDLFLDPRNPRLTDLGLGNNPTQIQIVDALWSKMAVDEVALSIAENGFYRHEPLYAAKEQGKLYVVEGNRRLAAVKLLRDAKLRNQVRANSLPPIGAAAKKSLETLPVIVCSRDQIWAFLGFKHINGPQAWEPYPKAHYIAWVHNDVGVPLEEIARRIGDKHSTVARLYDALMVLEQAETEQVFDREDRYKAHFSFSHLTTGLGYVGIQAFLGLPRGDRTIGKRRPIPKDHVRQLGEFLVWIFGRKSDDTPPVVQSQNPDLRRLDEILKSREATAALRKGLPLTVSLEISKGDERVFRESLVTAKQSLQKARGTVLTGYDGNQDLHNTAKDIAELSDALLEDMGAPRLKRVPKIGARVGSARGQ
jgi:hypothetical protein